MRMRGPRRLRLNYCFRKGAKRREWREMTPLRRQKAGWLRRKRESKEEREMTREGWTTRSRHLRKRLER
jgi:hypothetical protein